MSMTTKDAYWFSHDSNAKDDPKIMLLIDQLGLEGYGAFWVLIETLRDQPGYRYPIKMLPILARRYYTSGEKLLTIVRNYDLFDISDDTFFFSPALSRRMQALDERREQARQAGLASGKKRKLLQEKNDRSTTVQHEFNGSRTIRIEKNRLDKIKEEVKPELHEAIFVWLLYKQQRKEKNYTDIGFDQFIKKLNEMSEGNSTKAMKIVEQSMANNWQGIFDLKEKNKALPPQEHIPVYRDLATDLHIKAKKI